MELVRLHCKVVSLRNKKADIIMIMLTTNPTKRSLSISINPIPIEEKNWLNYTTKWSPMISSIISNTKGGLIVLTLTQPKGFSVSQQLHPYKEWNQ